MSVSCPLLFRQIDATVSKISTTFVLIFMGVYFATGLVEVLLFVIIDLGIRLSGYKEYSPIYVTAQCVQTFLQLPVKMEDAGGKRLAAFFGLTFVLGMVISHFADWDILQIALATLFLVCALPDIMFGYCIACKIYSCTKKMYPKAFE